MSIRVVLVDDQALIRSAMNVLVADTDDMAVVGDAGTGEEALAVVRDTRPDVVVMDIRMPGMDGIEATRQITAGAGGPRVLILTTFDEDEYVYAALRAGASGFLVKDSKPEGILDAIRIVADGEALLAPGVTRRLIDEFVRRADLVPAAALRPLGVITDREREVLSLIGRGRSNTEIAADLSITEATVKAHISRLFTKLDARDRVQLVILAYETGLASRSW